MGLCSWTVLGAPLHDRPWGSLALPGESLVRLKPPLLLGLAWRCEEGAGRPAACPDLRSHFRGHPGQRACAATWPPAWARLLSPAELP